MTIAINFTTGGVNQSPLSINFGVSSTTSGIDIPGIEGEFLFGGFSVRMLQTLEPLGIPSGAQVGAILIRDRYAVVPDGFGPTAVVGEPFLGVIQSISVGGVESTAAVGIPTVPPKDHILLGGISSGEQVGPLALYRNGDPLPLEIPGILPTDSVGDLQLVEAVKYLTFAGVSETSGVGVFGIANTREDVLVSGVDDGDAIGGFQLIRTGTVGFKPTQKPRRVGVVTSRWSSYSRQQRASLIATGLFGVVLDSTRLHLCTSVGESASQTVVIRTTGAGIAGQFSDALAVYSNALGTLGATLTYGGGEYLLQVQLSATQPGYGEAVVLLTRNYYGDDVTIEIPVHITVKP